LFRDAFEKLPAYLKYLDGVALILMATVIALLIAAALYHLIAASGEDSGKAHAFIGLMAGLALFPFAISLGVDIFITITWMAGFRTGLILGASFGALALFWWYGFEFLRASSIGEKERTMTAEQRDKVQKTPLDVKIDQMLTEARVILPGAQALLGFQLIVIITEAFDKLPATSKVVHAISLGLIALTVILLMAPAAYHRIVYAGEDTPEFHRTGSAFVIAATVPLALGLSTDVYVAIRKIAESSTLGIVVAGAVLVGYTGLWHIYPALMRTHDAAAHK
jgi:hypothetical protein